MELTNLNMSDLTTFLFFAQNITPAHLQPGIACNDDFTRIRSHCYHVSGDQNKFQNIFTADAYCKSKSAKLAEPKSHQELKGLFPLTKQFDQVWIAYAVIKVSAVIDHAGAPGILKDGRKLYYGSINTFYELPANAVDMWHDRKPNIKTRIRENNCLMLKDGLLKDFPCVVSRMYVALCQQE